MLKYDANESELKQNLLPAQEQLPLWLAGINTGLDDVFRFAWVCSCSGLLITVPLVARTQSQSIVPALPMLLVEGLFLAIQFVRTLRRIALKAAAMRLGAQLLGYATMVLCAQVFQSLSSPDEYRQAARGVGTVLFATGYAFAGLWLVFSLIYKRVLDSYGLGPPGAPQECRGTPALSVDPALGTSV